MEKVRLQLSSVSEIVGNDNLGLIVLTDNPCKRQLTIVCEQYIASQLEMRAKGIPISKMLLPEVLSYFITRLAGIQIEIIIHDLVDGQYRAVIKSSQIESPVPIRVSDAVLLSVAGNIPLYIDSQLMNRQSVPFSQLKEGVALPVNTLSNDMLDYALEKAVNEENYELASQLRDERNKRKKTTNKQEEQ